MNNRYMTPHEVEASALEGCIIACKLIMFPKLFGTTIKQLTYTPSYNSALRFMMAKSGDDAAIALAQRLCGMTGHEATVHVRNLGRTKNTDIQDLYANNQ